jgi:hypothetical protein
MGEGAGDLHAITDEFPDDAAYAWWRNAHPAGFILAVRARKDPVLHRATCKDVDRDRKPGALKAKGSRQICAVSAQALRAWLAREIPEAHGLLARCPKCGP